MPEKNSLTDTSGVGDQKEFSQERTRELVTHMAQIMAHMKRPPADLASPEERAAYEHRNDLQGIIHMDNDAVTEQLYIMSEEVEELEKSARKNVTGKNEWSPHIT